jgi:hypothetical protein
MYSMYLNEGCVYVNENKKREMVSEAANVFNGARPSRCVTVENGEAAAHKLWWDPHTITRQLHNITLKLSLLIGEHQLYIVGIMLIG